VIPTFRVVALGVSGSGKTVFLASMFHKLNVQRAGVAYFLETTAAQRVALSATFREVANPDLPWPAGTSTGEIREFTFDCASFHEGVKYKVLRISYLDYAGELLELEQEGGGTKLAELEAHINVASALLGIIDGRRVLQYLRGEPEGFEYFHASIQPMIGMMAGATCPIHFVLTKWDLVRDFGEPADADDDTRLKIVLQALAAVTSIEALASQHRGRRIVRLIPVSAVGRHFAEILPSGKVVKRPNGALRPTNVEVPLSAVVPDLFRQVEASLDQSVRDEIRDQLRSHVRLTPAAFVAALAKLIGVPAGVVIRTTLQTTIGRGYGDEIADAFIDWIGKPFDEQSTAIERARDEAERQAAILRHVRTEVLKEFEKTVYRLEALVPPSVLSRT
jgi:hypothetical protein